MRWNLLTLAAALAAALGLASPVRATADEGQPRATASAYISVAYGKRVIRRYINDEYVVAIGPNFGSCVKLAANTVRCEVEFKAGLYWRCGRVSVRNSGRYDHITARLPIGC